MVSAYRSVFLCYLVSLYFFSRVPFHYCVFLWNHLSLPPHVLLPTELNLWVLPFSAFFLGEKKISPLSDIKSGPVSSVTVCVSLHPLTTGWGFCCLFCCWCSEHTDREVISVKWCYAFKKNEKKCCQTYWFRFYYFSYHCLSLTG